jgi:cellulose synthase/poly-beta-1,6-N-acetylglucosamine synthase-like glycosyltransferase
MIYVFYFFAAVIVFLGYKSLRGGIDYLSFFQKELAKPKSNFTPFCSVIVPCRGLDEDLAENLAALFRQNFPSYEIVFVIDDEEDEAVSVIKKLIHHRDTETQRKFNRERQNEPDKEEKNSVSQCLSGENLVSAKLVVAGKATDSSQKVHNLRRAVLQAADKSEIFVFLDSDARPDVDWLRNLIAPLEAETVGCTTGYRWFVQKRGGFASALRSVWNASIASALGANTKSNFCWGGSMAMRRATFERLNISERLKGTLSDDFTVTRAMKEANLPICFVPQCLTATVEDCTFRELVEFSTRQMKITRVYAEHLWKASLIGSLLFTAIFWTGIVLLFFLSGFHFWLTLCLLLIIFALGGSKAWLRLKAVEMSLKNYEKQLNRQLLPHLTLWIVTPILYFYNCFCALFSRKIIWRGIAYELKSATETDILSTKRL